MPNLDLPPQTVSTHRRPALEAIVNKTTRTRISTSVEAPHLEDSEDSATEDLEGLVDSENRTRQRQTSKERGPRLQSAN